MTELEAHVTDLLTIGGRVYYLADYSIYELRSGEPELLTSVNSDVFTYVLLGNYEDDTSKTTPITESPKIESAVTKLVSFASNFLILSLFVAEKSFILFRFDIRWRPVDYRLLEILVLF